jgi:hypothetical protein
MAKDVTKVTSSIDFKRLVADAEAAGFNPLTVLRAGAAAGYGVTKQTVTYDPISGAGAAGSFTPPVEEESPVEQPPLTSTPTPGSTNITNVIAELGGQTAYLSAGHSLRELGFGGSVSDERPGPWELESEINIALHQLSMRQANSQSAQGQQGGMFNPIAVTAPGAVVNGRAAASVVPMPAGGPLAVGKPTPLQPVYAGGNRLAMDLGWSNAGDAEERWGESEFLSPTWFYSWGVAGADIGANLDVRNGGPLYTDKIVQDLWAAPGVFGDGLRAIAQGFVDTRAAERSPFGPDKPMAGYSTGGF